MVWTLQDALTAELARPDADIRRIVDIVIDGSTTYSFVDGESILFGYPASVIDVADASHEIDPLTRETSIGEMSVRFAGDGAMRTIIRGEDFIGKGLTIRLGTANIIESSYVTIWAGVIKDFDVDASGEITVKAGDGFGYLKDIEITGGWVMMHPIELLRDIIGSAETWNAPGVSVLGGLPATLWDESTFDPADYPEISHWMLSRWETEIQTETRTLIEYNPYGGPARGLAKLKRLTTVVKSMHPTEGSVLATPTNAWQLCQELLTMLNGTITIDSSGRLGFRRYDDGASVVRHWERRQILEWKQASAAKDISNRLDVTYGAQTLTEGAEVQQTLQDRIYRLNETGSQSDHAFPGESSRVYSLGLDYRWARAIGRVNNFPRDSGTTLEVRRAALVGFAGARWVNGYAGPTNSFTPRSALRTSGVTVTSNVATATIDTNPSLTPLPNPNPHWLQVGDYISTRDLTTNVTNVAITARTATTISYPCVAANGAMADGVGDILPQPMPNDTLASGREATFLIINVGTEEEQVEIVRATAATVGSTTLGTPTPQHTPGIRDEYYYPDVTSYTITRAQDGTSAIDIWDEAIVIDITIPRAMAYDRTARIANGMPMIECSTPMTEVDVQIGDFVTHDYPAYTARSAPAAGADDTIVFEVVGKKIRKNRIDWTLAWAYDTAPAAATSVVEVPGLPFGGLAEAPWPHYSISMPSSSSCFLEMYDPSVITFPDAFTISLWANLGNAYPASAVSLVGEWETGQRNWRIDVETSGAVTAYIAASTGDTGANYVRSNSDLFTATNLWRQIVVRYNAGTLEIFALNLGNNLLEAVASTTTGSIPSAMVNGTSQIQVGSNGNDAAMFLNGYLAHVAFFDRALSYEDINLTRTPTGRPANLFGIAGRIAWWQFQQNLRDSVNNFPLIYAGANSNHPQYSLRYPGV